MNSCENKAVLPICRAYFNRLIRVSVNRVIYFSVLVLLLAFICKTPSIAGSGFRELRVRDGFIPDSTVTVMALGRDSRVWTGTLGGVAVYDAREMKSRIYRAEERGVLSGIGLLDNQVWCLAVEDRRERGERVWIGTGAGLCSFDGHVWVHYDRDYFRQQGDAYGDAQDVAASPRVISVPGGAFEGVWLGGPTGLFRYDGMTWQQISLDIPVGISPTGIVRQGDLLWISTHGAGLVRLDAELNVKKWAQGSGLLSNNVSAVLVRSNQEIWAGTDRGISVLRAGSWEALTTAGSHNIGQVNALVEDVSGSVWVGTDRGLHRWNGVHWLYYDQTYGGLPSSKIWSLLEVPRPATGKLEILIGTAGGGLVRFEGYIDHEMDVVAELRNDAQSALDRRLYQQALSLYRQILELFPDDGDAIHAIGQINLQQNQYRTALDYFLRAMDLEPERVETYVLAADALRHLGGIRQALVFLKTASAMEPGRMDLMLAMADMYLAEGDTGLAAEIYQRILSIDDRNRMANRGLVSCYEQLGLYFNAINTLEGMRRRFPGDESVPVSLARLYLRQGLILEAMREINRGMEFSPNNPDLHRIMGQIYMEQNLLEQAQAELRLAIRLNPRDAEAHADLALVYYRQRQFDMMAGALDRALEIDQLNPTAYYVLGMRAYDSRDWEEARTNFETSLAIDPGNPWTHYRLAMTYQHLRFLDAAHLAYQKVMAIRPDFPEASRVREAMRLLEQ